MVNGGIVNGGIVNGGAEFRDLRPRIVTEAELVQKLWPVISNYAWALDTIGDLWRMGAPTPNSRLGTPAEKRILLPRQFEAWWSDVQQRMGLEPGAVDVLRSI